MFTVDQTLPINRDRGSGEPKLTRSQIWHGLTLKAEDAVPFVPAMTECRVTERFENGIYRDIVFNGEPMTEKIIFYPEEKVEFIRTEGIEMGAILNEIIEDEDGELHLRFAFTLARDDLPDGSAEEQAFADTMARGYLVAVRATIDEIRRLVGAGALAAE